MARVFLLSAVSRTPHCLLSRVYLQGNFAQFLESADSVVSLTASEAGSGSFVNLFALTELKVGERIAKEGRRWMAALSPRVGCHQCHQEGLLSGSVLSSLASASRPHTTPFLRVSG